MPFKLHAAARVARGRRAKPARLAASAGVLFTAFAVGTISLYLVAHRHFAPVPQSSVRAHPGEAPSVAAPRATVRRADFRGEQASVVARQIADWVIDSADNQGMPFVIVDKVGARILAFDAGGRLTGAAPALLGITRGDDSAPGIGEKALSDITGEEKTTPAGRFVAELGHNSHGEDVVWVDYDAGFSLHRVLRTIPGERRQHRLDTPTIEDNRISFGCINVPVPFYEHVIRPAFLHGKGIVYVLPEVKSAREVFGAYDVDERARAQQAALPRNGKRPQMHNRAG